MSESGPRHPMAPHVDEEPAIFLPRHLTTVALSRCPIVVALLLLTQRAQRKCSSQENALCITAVLVRNSRRDVSLRQNWMRLAYDTSTNAIGGVDDDPWVRVHPREPSAEGSHFVRLSPRGRLRGAGREESSTCLMYAAISTAEAKNCARRIVHS